MKNNKIYDRNYIYEYILKLNTNELINFYENRTKKEYRGQSKENIIKDIMYTTTLDYYYKMLKDCQKYKIIKSYDELTNKKDFKNLRRYLKKESKNTIITCQNMLIKLTKINYNETDLLNNIKYIQIITLSDYYII